MEDEVTYEANGKKYRLVKGEDCHQCALVEDSEACLSSPDCTDETEGMELVYEEIKEEK